MATKKKRVGIEGLGDTDREAVQVMDRIRELCAARATAARSIKTARETLGSGRGSAYFDAKRTLTDPYATLKKTLEISSLTEKTSGKKLDSLPRYGDSSHPFMQAHTLADKLRREIAKTEGMSKAMSKATYGDEKQVREAVRALRVYELQALREQRDARRMARASRRGRRRRVDVRAMHPKLFGVES